MSFGNYSYNSTLHSNTLLVLQLACSVAKMTLPLLEKKDTELIL